MARVFLVHWDEPEARSMATDLQWSGHEVAAHFSSEVAPSLGEAPPDVVVISLVRLPSHGTAVAAWIGEAERRRELPIVFSGGEPDKVAGVRAKFPAAIFCAADELAATLARITRPPSAPGRAKTELGLGPMVPPAPPRREPAVVIEPVPATKPATKSATKSAARSAARSAATKKPAPAPAAKKMPVAAAKKQPAPAAAKKQPAPAAAKKQQPAPASATKKPRRR